MTGPNDRPPHTRPISVAELLAKNGTIGAPVTGRRRRRRSTDDTVTVAELTGEIPVVDDDVEPDEFDYPDPGPPSRRGYGAEGIARLDEPVRDRPVDNAPYWSEPQPRWPESPPPRPRRSRPAPGESRPERSPFPLPTRNSARLDARRSGDRPERPEERNGAEGMNPDPLEDYAGMTVDVMDTDVRDAEPVIEDSAYVRSYLRSPVGRPARERGAPRAIAPRRGEDYRDIGEADYPDDDLVDEVEEPDAWPDEAGPVMRGGMVVLQSILAVAFGAGLFLAFDELWRWNNIVALVLSVLVILGLVVGVRVVRKTEDIASTLIAVAVGALVTLGPLALLQSG
jgi:hypothetical protein